MAEPVAQDALWDPVCAISLLSGSTVSLPVFGQGGGGGDGGDDLQDLLLRAVELFTGLPGASSSLALLPLQMLVLSDNTVGSPHFGQTIPSPGALREHAEVARSEPAGDGRGATLCFTLTVRDLEESTCGVRRCRDKLIRQSGLHRRCDNYDYGFTYPVAFMVLDQARITFPRFSRVSVNMMPFVMGRRRSLPWNLQHYWPMIQACGLEQKDPGEIGKIGYLTVDEREIEEDQTTHRRGGLHTDSPGVHLPGVRPTMPAPTVRYHLGEERWDAYQRGDLAKNPGHPHGRCPDPTEDPSPATPPPRSPRDFHARGVGEKEVQFHHWGMGWVMGTRGQGGIYLASNVDESTQIYNAIVEDPALIGRHGNCEHLRDFIGSPTTLKAGELCWLTDRTPHESMPLPAGTRRQFFRLVTSRVGVWFADHSTPNPTGVVPDPEVTRIVHGSKFGRAPLQVAPTVAAARASGLAGVHASGCITQ